METEAGVTAESLTMVVVRVADLLCALPLADVIETLRCPALIAISGTPQYVTGVAMIRGATVAVVDLGMLLGTTAAASRQARLVTLRVGIRTVALAVSAVVGVREIVRSELFEVPPMLARAHAEVLTNVGSLDHELLLVLEGSRILTAEIMERSAA